MFSTQERSQTVPNIYQSYYQDGDYDIVKEADERYSANISSWQTYLYEQTIDRKVYLGDTRYLNSYLGLGFEQQKFIFNKTISLVNMISGRQMQHRKGTQFLPIFNSSNRTASQATKIVQGAYGIDKTYEKFSECFKESLITGLSFMHSYIDYRYDPICGDLKTECLTPDMLITDCFWRERTLDDCQMIRTRKYYHKNQVKQMLPGREKDVDLLNSQAYYDTKFTFMPQQYNIRKRDYIAYDEYWYQATRKATFLVDSETYESIEVNLTKEDEENIHLNFPNVVIVRENVPTVKLAIILNGNNCFYNGPNPLKIDKYPFNPFLAYHDKANNNYAFRYFGAPRIVRDSQYLVNYRTQLELDLLAAQFSGVDVEEDALIDDQDAFKIGPGKVRFFKKGRIQAIQDKPGANINPANFEATQKLVQNIQSDAGVTPELLGLSQDNDVGITEKLRQDAGLMTLQELMSNLELSQMQAGNIHWEIIQKNYTYGKIKRMLGEEPTNEFKDKTFQKYDAVVGFAPLTDTTKQLAFMQKYNLFKDGFPIPIDILISDLTIQDKDKLVEAVQQQMQQRQEQEMAMAQAQLENQQIVNNSLLSKAESDRALAEERIHKGRLEEMQIETAYNKSRHEVASATLNAVKTAKEIENTDFDRVLQVLSLIENIRKPQDELKGNSSQVNRG